MDMLINNNFDYINRLIKSQLNQFLFKHKRFVYADFNTGDTIKKSIGESKKNYIKRIFKEDPLFIINNIIDSIDTFLYDNTYKVETENTFYESILEKKIFFRKKIILNDIKYLTSINDLKVDIKLKTYLYNYISNFYVESIDKFGHEITIFVDIEFSEVITYLIDDMYFDISFEYKGLKPSNNLPIWMEYLIEGAIYQSNNNLKLSLFNYFVSFDSFIQTVYNQIHKHYNIKRFEQRIEDQFNHFIDEKTEEIIDLAIEYEYGSCLLSDKLYDKFVNDNDEYINEELSYYLNCHDDMMQTFHTRIIKEYEYYSRQDKRLIEQKLKDIENLLDINLNTNEFSGLSNLKGRIKIIEKYRNIIAHGDDVEVIPTGDEFYEIFSYIISIIYQYDFDRSYWNELLTYK